MKKIHFLCSALFLFTQIAHASTFSVTTINDSGAGSLRQAILDANTTAGADTIAFNIGSGVKTISPATALPTITDAVVIDGTTQPGFAGTPLIEVNGTLSGGNGLVIIAGNSTVRGLVINRFGHGIILGGGTNVIAGNYIGTDVTGGIARGNTTRGIWVTNAVGNLIGGTTASARNLISGNTFNGVEISGAGASNNLVQGNFIGTTASGTSALTNNGDGVLIQNFASNNTIGGTTSGARNIISASGAAGVEISTAPGNFVQGNFIGTDLNGTAALGNRLDGVRVITSGTTIGGTVAGAGNLISGNFTNGLVLFGNGNLVQGNFIGTDSSGTAALPNEVDGVALLSTASFNTIGGTNATARNIISGNSANGIHINGINCTNNIILGNYVGLAVNGSNGLGNILSGILVERAPNNVIGGTGVGAGNVISANNGHGIYVFGVESSGAIIQGNFVGTDASGLVGVGNSGGGQGIRIEAGSATIGGAAGARNVVSSANSDGILLIGNDAAHCLVAGNYVGTRADGTSGFMGNTTGILLNLGAHNNTIGGSTGNLIAYNSIDGVVVGGALTVSNSIYGNMIFSNANMGINLEPTSTYTGTVTTNDLGDADIGGNNLQNFPVLNPITNSSGNTVISGTLNSAANRLFYIDLYRSSSVDPSGYGEGEFYIGYTSVTTDGSGNASFTYNLSGSFPNQYFTATATDGSTLDTSEFSQAAQAAAGRFVFLTNNMTVNENAGTVFITVNRIGGSYGTASVQVNAINDSANNDLDFNFGGATLNFDNGQTTGGFNIAIIDDTTDEPDENFFLQLSSPVGATTGFPSQLLVNILDNDPPSISVPDTHVVEGNSGTRNVVLNFNLSSTSSLPVSVNFKTTDGTAIAGTDYQTFNSLVTFAPGQTNRVITLSGAVIGDTLQEPNETFFVNLFNPTNATLARTEAVVTIIDDDPLPTLHIAQITNNSVRLTWTTNAFGFLLESNANLSSLIWNTVSNTPVVTGTNFAVTNLMSSNAFYRLNFP